MPLFDCRSNLSTTAACRASASWARPSGASSPSRRTSPADRAVQQQQVCQPLSCERAATQACDGEGDQNIPVMPGSDNAQHGAHEMAEVAASRHSTLSKQAPSRAGGHARIHARICVGRL